MRDKVIKTIEKYSLLKRGDRVVIGLSGGADSVSLTSVLLSMREEYCLDLEAVHINHGIRGEQADRDEAFVREFCDKNSLPLTVYRRSVPTERLKTGEGEEECGRRIRYECFNERAKNGHIATAHTATDSNETLIFNIVRGTGSGGLRGISPKRENIIRPLIECSREEIEKYCSSNGLSYVTDSTNFETDYTRNFIRLELMPMFKRINPSYSAALTRLRGMAEQDNDFLENASEELYYSFLTEKGLSSEALSESHPSLSSRAVIKLIKDNTGLNPQGRHIDLIMSSLKNGICVQLSEKYRVWVKDGSVYVEENNTALPENVPAFELFEGMNETFFGNFEIRKYSRENYNIIKNSLKVLDFSLDCDKIKGHIFVRSRKEGDKVTLLKRNVTKSLKKLYCEMKIPPEKRMYLPVICDEEKVLWSYSSGVNRECAVTGNTENITIISFDNIRNV